MEYITKRQRRFLMKWTVIMGILCGIIAGFVLLTTGKAGMSEGAFWFQAIVVAAGGGILLGLIPAILVEYRNKTNE